jgi:hypothetical protein
MAGALVEWQRVKDILTLDDDREETVMFLIASACAQAEKHAGRILAAQDVELTLDASGGRELLLPVYPVNSVVRICIDPAREFPSGLDVPPGEYGLQKEAGIIRLYSRLFPRGYNCVLFSGNAGYDPVPEDLQQAVIEVVSANLRRLSSSGGLAGIKSISTNGAISTNYELDIPLSARNLFLSYRGVRV